jgi:cohesin loading factor subunit SCC2
VSDIEMGTLARVLKALERSVRAAENLDPFKIEAGPAKGGSGGGEPRSRPRSVTLSPSKKRGKKAKAVAEVEEAAAANGDAAEVDTNDNAKTNADQKSLEPTESDLHAITAGLGLAIESVLAADACMTLLASDRLPKQLYSEELITACLLAVKSHLTQILYPFVENSGNTNTSLDGGYPLLHHILLVKPPVELAGLARQHRAQLSELLQVVRVALPKINKLVHSDVMAMSDGIVIQAVYIAIGPFFLVEPEAEKEKGERGGGGGAKGKKEKENVVEKTLGMSALRGLRLDALSLLRSVRVLDKTSAR